MSNKVKIMTEEFTGNLTYYQGNTVEKERGGRYRHTGIWREAVGGGRERESGRDCALDKLHQKPNLAWHF